MRISFETAAAISGVTPSESAASLSVLASSDRSQSRNSPTVIDATGAKAFASWLSKISRVTSSASAGTISSARNLFSGTSAKAMRAATRSASVAAASPASLSPEREGEAFASSVRRSVKLWRVPAAVET